MTEQKQPPTNVNRVRFRAGNIIMDNWSDEAGRYKQGWSDDRVSKETGLSEAAIKRMREDDLGLKQRVPPEVESLEARLSTMFESLTDMENELQKIRQKYEAA